MAEQIRRNLAMLFTSRQINEASAPRARWIPSIYQKRTCTVIWIMIKMASK